MTPPKISRLTVLALLWVLVAVAALKAQPQTPTAGQTWDRRYNREMYVYGKEPVRFLVDIIDRLRPGTALVLAAGEGRNAVYLAQRGFAVTAVDVSARGLAKCRALAVERGVQLTTVVADLDTFDIGKGRWDLITNFYYHDPGLYERIIAGLKPEGFFALQNFSIDQLTTNLFGPRSANWLVAPNQLPRAFTGWRIRHYEDCVVELDEGMHEGPGAVVRLLVQKLPVEEKPDP